MKDINSLDLKKKKYIIFDMDGTLIDSIGVWNRTDQRLIKEYGNIDVDLETIQKERDFFLHQMEESDIYLSYCEYLIKKYHLNVESSQQLLKIRWDLSGEVLEKEMDFKPNVVEFIFLLKRLGFTLILATMTTQVQLDIYSKKNKKMLSKMNLLEVFDLITRKEDVKRKKPNPEIYQNIRKHYHADASECLVLEDSYTGVLASKEAGIEVVNVYDKYADVDREKINQITDYRIDGYQELISFVESVYANVLDNKKGKIMMKKQQFDNLLKEMGTCTLCTNLKSSRGKNYSLFNIYKNFSFSKEIPSIWTDWYHRLDASIFIVGQDWGPYSDMRELNERYKQEKTKENWKRLIEEEKSQTKKRLTSFLVESSGGKIDSLDSIYITNAIMCARRGEKYRDDTIHLKYSTLCCSKFLKKQVELVKPKVIATLGYYPLLSLSEIFQFPIAKTLSECIEECPVIKKDNYVIIPLYHPVAQISRERQLKQYQRIWEYFQ